MTSIGRCSREAPSRCRDGRKSKSLDSHCLPCNPHGKCWLPALWRCRERHLAFRQYKLSFQLLVIICRAVTVWQPYQMLNRNSVRIIVHQNLRLLFLRHKPHQISGLEGDSRRGIQYELSVAFDSDNHGFKVFGQA